MSLAVVFKPAARIEFEEAVAWYEMQREDLGREFANEVYRTLERAQTTPEAFRKVRGRARKIRLRRFDQYSIYFGVEENALAVLAVFHGARNPRELHRRFK